MHIRTMCENSMSDIKDHKKQYVRLVYKSLSLNGSWANLSRTCRNLIPYWGSLYEDLIVSTHAWLNRSQSTLQKRICLLRVIFKK